LKIMLVLWSYRIDVVVNMMLELPSKHARLRQE